MKTNCLHALILFALLLSSCGAGTPMISPTETAVPATATFTPLPTDTPIPIPTLTPTITPTPMPQVITISNVDKLKVKKFTTINTGWWEMVTSSPDGKYFAAAGPAGVIFYDTETLERIKLFDVQDTTVAVAFSPDSSKIAVGLPGPNGVPEELEKRLAIEVWDLKTGKRLNRFTGFKDYWEVSSLSFSGDGCLIFSYSKIIHNICDNTEIKSGNDWRIKNEFYDQRTYFSLDGQLGLVHIASDWGVWDVKNNNKLRNLILRRPSFSPDSKRIMDLAEKRIFLYETSDFSKSLEFNTKAKIVTAKISFDGAYVATAENDSMLRLYDAMTGELKSETQSSMYLVAGLNFTPDGKFITMLDDRGYLKKSELPSLNAIQERNDQPVNWPLVISPDGKWIAMTALTFSYLSGGYDTLPGDQVVLFDSETLEITNQLGDGEPADRGIRALAFSPDGKMLAGASSHNGFVDLWDMSTLRLIKRVEISPGKKYSAMDSTGNIWGGVTFNADGTLVAAMNPIPSYTQIYIWDVSSGKLITNFKPPLYLHPTLKDIKSNAQYIDSIDFDPNDDSKLMFGWLGSYDWRNKKWIENTSNISSSETSCDGEMIILSGFDRFKDRFAVAYSPNKNWEKYNNCRTNGQDCLFWGKGAGKILFSPDGLTLLQFAEGKISLWQVIP